MWVKIRGWDGKEVVLDIYGVRRDEFVLYYYSSNGKIITDSGRIFTEEEAINNYNKIVDLVKPIDLT